MTVGQMTMYLMLFRQGQSAVSAALSAISGLYEDNLYLSNLYEYLEQPIAPQQRQRRARARPGDGIRFENVEFIYPGATAPALPTSICTFGRARAWRWSGRTARARPP